MPAVKSEQNLFSLKAGLSYSVHIFLQESEMTRYKNNAMKEARMDCQIKQLEKENTGLRNHIFSLQGEVYGARLAAKYLDKELAGRYHGLSAVFRGVGWGGAER